MNLKEKLNKEYPCPLIGIIVILVMTFGVGIITGEMINLYSQKIDIATLTDELTECHESNQHIMSEIDGYKKLFDRCLNDLDRALQTHKAELTDAQQKAIFKEPVCDASHRGMIRYADCQYVCAGNAKTPYEWVNPELRKCEFELQNCIDLSAKLNKGWYDCKNEKPKEKPIEIKPKEKDKRMLVVVPCEGNNLHFIKAKDTCFEIDGCQWKYICVQGCDENKFKVDPLKNDILSIELYDWVYECNGGS